MARELISHTFPAIINGMSQQHYKVRLESQSEYELNTDTDVVRGMSKRKGTHRVASLPAAYEDCYLHMVDRSDDEQYAMAFQNGDLTVVDLLTGNTVPVEYSVDAKDYLTTTKPAKDSFSAVTVADTTWVLNKTIEIEQAPYVAPTPDAPPPPEPANDTTVTPLLAPINVGTGKNSGGYWVFYIGKYKVEQSRNVGLRRVVSLMAEAFRKTYPSYTVTTVGDSIVIRHPVGATVSLTDKSYTYSYSGYGGTTKRVTAHSKSTTAASDQIVSPQDIGGIVYLRQVDYDVEYRITIDGISLTEAGQTYAYKTPDTPTNGSRDGLSYYQVLAGISSVVNGPANTTGVRCTLTDHYLALYHEKGDDFTVDVSSDYTNDAIKCIKDNAQTYADLPPYAPEGFHVEIKGDPDAASNSYYLEYVTNEGTSTGTWEETTDRGISNSINASTFPHVITRRFRDNGDTYFLMSVQQLDERASGDNENNPFPTFCKDLEDPTSTVTCQDIFFFRNRLGILSGDSTILSVSGTYTDWFIASMVSGLATDPIDIASPTSEVANLDYAVQLNRELLLISNKTQQLIQTGDSLTPDTVAVPQLASYDVDTNIRPITLGDRMFYVTYQSGYSSLHEATILNVDENLLSQDVGAHVPTFLDGRVTLLTGSDLNNKIILATDQGKLYCYSYMYNQQERLQSAWCEWATNGEVLGAKFIRDILYIIVKRNGVIYLENLYFNKDPSESIYGFPICVDSQRVEQDSYTLLDGEIEFRDPKSGDRVVGYQYQMRYQWSPIVFESNERAIQRARLQIRNLRLSYDKSGYFEVHVTPEGRETRVDVHTGRTLGSLINIIGQYPIQTGEMSVPILSNGETVKIEIVSDKAFPLSIQSAGYEAMLNLRTNPR